MKIKLFALIVMILAFSGCEKETGTNPENITYEIQPLNTGNTYHYIDSTINGGELTVDSVMMTVSGHTTVTGEPNAQGVAQWDVYRNGIYLKRYFLNLEQDGVYHYAEINNDDTLWIRKLWAKYPINVGDQFLEPKFTYNAATGEYQSMGNYKWHCVSIDSQIRIKSGETLFSHIFRAEPETGTEVYLAYALGVGYMGMQINRLGLRVYSETLLYYELK